MIHFAETLELGPLLPGEVAALQWTIPADSLPPAAERFIAGESEPVPGCFPGTQWPGQLRVEWSEAGTNEKPIFNLPSALPDFSSVVVFVPAYCE